MLTNISNVVVHILGVITFWDSVRVDRKDESLKNLPANAGDADSTPGPGTKIPHSMGQLSFCVPQLLSPHSRAHELELLSPSALEPVLHNKRSPHREKPRHCK